MPREEESIATQDRRRQPRDKASQLRPFSRANQLTDIALYWLPVSQYPMRSRERSWIMSFMKLLKFRLAQEKKLRLETFLQFKSIYPELLNRFLSRSREYQPLTGLLLQPESKPPELPTVQDVEAEVKKGGAVDVNQWMADYAYWFMVKQDEQQREDFLGLGGMIFLFLAANDSKPPELKIPRVMRTHPAFREKEVQAQMAIAEAMQDKFLKQSKETFGELVRDDPAYPGIPYILPLLKSEDFFRATSDLRAKWFEVFDVYCIESKLDKGMLLAVNDPEFDQILIALLQELRESGVECPL